jgi:hypothetical protein
MKYKMISDESMSRTVADMQMTRHVMDGHPSIILNCGKKSKKAFLFSGCGKAP